MMAQFLLLMVMLDKLWFTPVGRVLDERDALIRSKLAGALPPAVRTSWALRMAAINAQLCTGNGW
eukprot:943631-Pelagomonas_calceolata.AAC.2